MSPEKSNPDPEAPRVPGDAPMDEIVRALRSEYWQSLEAGREVQARVLDQYVSFALAGQTYAVPIGQIREVTLMPGISRLPRSPSHLPGVINLRGRIIPLIDLRPLIGVSDREIEKGFRVLVTDGRGQEVGIIVEKVLGILEVEPEDVRHRRAGEEGEGDAYLTGQIETEDRTTIILDTEKLVESEAVRIREEGR